MRLDLPGYVVALRVTRDYGIQVIAPQSGSPTSKPESLETLVRSIPEPLIASRTKHWAAYYAAFGVPGTR